MKFILSRTHRGLLDFSAPHHHGPCQFADDTETFVQRSETVQFGLRSHVAIATNIFLRNRFSENSHSPQHSREAFGTSTSEIRSDDFRLPASERHVPRLFITPWPFSSFGSRRRSIGREGPHHEKQTASCCFPGKKGVLKRWPARPAFPLLDCACLSPL